MAKPVIGLMLGDVTGIGPEICAKLLASGATSNLANTVVIGDRRKYLTALVMIDHDNVAKFAQDKGVPFSNYASLCRAREVVDLIREEVDKVNKTLARVETVKKFRLIDTLLTAEDEELTPTMKLKRKLVNAKYKPLIDSMYGED